MLYIVTMKGTQMKFDPLNPDPNTMAELRRASMEVRLQPLREELDHVIARMPWYGRFAMRVIKVYSRAKSWFTRGRRLAR